MQPNKRKAFSIVQKIIQKNILKCLHIKTKHHIFASAIKQSHKPNLISCQTKL